MYFLWWMSVITIFYEDGYHPEQDNVWVISFTAVLLALWFLKKMISKDAKILFFKDINPYVSKFLIIFALLSALLMLSSIFFPIFKE